MAPQKTMIVITKMLRAEMWKVKITNATRALCVMPQIQRALAQTIGRQVPGWT